MHPVIRFLLYGGFGIIVEVFFCAVWKFVTHRCAKLHGFSSIWSLFVYGLGFIMLERLITLYKTRLRLAFWARVPLHLAGIYLWELLCGLLLSQFNANSWDYSAYSHYHLWGLVNFDYAPAWLAFVAFSDAYFVPFVSRLELARHAPPPASPNNKDFNKDNSKRRLAARTASLPHSNSNNIIKENNNEKNSKENGGVRHHKYEAARKKTD